MAYFFYKKNGNKTLQRQTRGVFIFTNFIGQIRIIKEHSSNKTHINRRIIPILLLA
jgi:hypothetical protein